jgi:aerobic carbon-monoxide dehydrogenase medium subunit
MIPAAFEYVRTTSLSATIDLLQNDPDGAKLVAGGHTLIPAMKLRLASPALLVDIRGIDELKGIEIGERIRIGALTTHAELLASDPLHQMLPIFREAAGMIADAQVRNRGTIGGSLANADPAADWPAVVIALNAEMEIAGANGRRRVAAKDFFVDLMTTTLAPDEVLVALHIARPGSNVRFGYRKIRHPASGYAVVGIAAALALHDDLVSTATIGVTGATARAFGADIATAFLIGKSLSSDNIKRVASIVSENAQCLSDHYASADYRRHLVRTQLARMLSSWSSFGPSL